MISECWLKKRENFMTIIRCKDTKIITYDQTFRLHLWLKNAKYDTISA